MARLQDFQSVTPNTANDNLLIVQSAGQGNAKIDVVGQKIATNTTHSGLTTTSKKLVGAINELKTRVDGKENTVTWDTKPTAGHGSGYAVTSAGLAKLNDCIVLSSKLGSIASFSTDVVDRLYSCKANIVAQPAGTGTPAPDNVRAISGFSEIALDVIGKNFYPIKVGLDLFADNRSASHTTTNDILTITMDSQNNSGVYGGTGTVANNTICQTIKKFSGNFVLSLYAKSSSDNKDVYFGFQSFTSVVETLTTEWKRVELPMTLDNAIHTLNFYNRSSTAITVDIKDLQIELGTTATDYEEYKGTTHTIPLGQTIYGGTAELVGGSGVKDYGYIEFDGSSDEDWSYASGNKWATITISDMMSGANQDGITNWLPKSTSYGTFGFALGRNNNNFYAYQIPDISGVTDLASWKTYLSNNPLQVVYPLATPTTFTFTGANILTLGNGQINNAYANSGDVDLKYLETIGNKFNS